MSQESDSLDKAVRNLGVLNKFRSADREIHIACLVREADWRPLKAAWWRGKEVCIIGADLDGNFLLRHCDGTVRHWNHQSQADTIVAASVREFLSKIAE